MRYIGRCYVILGEVLSPIFLPKLNISHVERGCVQISVLLYPTERNSFLKTSFANLKKINVLFLGQQHDTKNLDVNIEKIVNIAMQCLLFT